MEEEREQLYPILGGQNRSDNYEATTNYRESSDRMGLVNNEGKKLPQYIAALAATLGAVAAGTVLGYTSPTEIEFETTAPLGFNITEAEFKWVGSLTPLGCVCMCFVVGFILDFLGRKPTMLIMVAVFALGWALIIWAQNVGMVFAGRFLTGMASGTFCVAAPLYTSEIAQKEIRGSLGSYFQLMITVGILFVYVVGKYAEPQMLAIICGIVPFIFGLAFAFMPESPVYALKKGNLAKARRNLQWLRGKNYNVDDEIKEMQDIIDEENRSPISLSESLKKRATQKAFAISFGLMVIQQLSGINAVIFYSGSIFEDAGSSLEAKDAAIIVGVMQVLATLASTLVIDRLGRRILLLASAGVMAICAMLLGVFFYLKLHVMNNSEIQDIGSLPIVSLSVFVILFSLGFGPIPWMISAEVFPREVKSVASSAAGCLNWFLAFLVTLFFKSISDGIGSDKVFFIFMACCVLGCLYVFFIVPETKGKTLQQIQRELGGESPRSSGIVNEGFTT